MRKKKKKTRIIITGEYQYVRAYERRVAERERGGRRNIASGPARGAPSCGAARREGRTPCMSWRR